MQSAVLYRKTECADALPVYRTDRRYSCTPIVEERQKQNKKRFSVIPHSKYRRCSVISYKKDGRCSVISYRKDRRCSVISYRKDNSCKEEALRNPGKPRQPMASLGKC